MTVNGPSVLACSARTVAAQAGALDEHDPGVCDVPATGPQKASACPLVRSGGRGGPDSVRPTLMNLVSVELALVSLGTVAVHTATKLWLGEHPIVAEVGADVIDQLAGKLVKVIDRRRLAGTFDRFAEAAAERLELIVESEFRSLPEHERIAAIDADVAFAFARSGVYLSVARPPRTSRS